MANFSSFSPSLSPLSHIFVHFRTFSYNSLSSILVNRLVLNLRRAGRRDAAYTDATGSGDDTTDYEVPEFRVRTGRRGVGEGEGAGEDGRGCECECG